MNLRKLILTLISALVFTSLYANKDRMAKPVTFRFILSDNDTVNTLSSNVSFLKELNEDIIHHKKNLIEVLLTFKNGETIICKYENSTLTAMTIKYRKEELQVSKKAIKKLPEIHYATLCLLWSGNYDTAFEAPDFSIRFSAGTQKMFEQFSSIELHFFKKKFSGATMWMPVGKNSIQERGL